MSYNIQSILVNYLFIVVAVFWVQFAYEKSALSGRQKKIFLFCSMALCLLFGITFPFHVAPGHIFDLRLLPLIFGTIYGGAYVGIGLFGVFSVYRLITGGAGSYPALLIMMTLVIILCWFARSERTWSPKRRTAVMTLLAALGSTYFLTVFHFVFRVNVGSAETWLALIGIHTGGMLLLVVQTERMRYHFQLQQKVTQSEKLELVSHLAAAVSHEVRNPLTASRGFMQLLLEDEVEPERRKRFLQIAIDELDRAEGIIRDYLTFAKPETEHTQTLYVPDEIHRVVEILTPLANMHTVHILTHTTLCCVKGSPHLFTQSLLNIAKNAIEAMTEGGTLTIRLEQEGDKVCISLADTGTGMTEKQIQRLGEPYFSTKGTRGTGLGMMVTYRIISAMGGQIQVNSTVGKGTTFRILLPASRQPVPL
ncbi:ATP-binding protein [Ectobacillus ponti]|uniref:histidine kinase n=1 Tax=Ectobacillus ponti TaxID=2961894 RepID=A0AA42BRF5_9BACI|nr:ATP-binding protein [Ectobacillus ponti]MCP8971335.1 ATP-binding protein [Ectobacillus ponti]